ASPAVVGSVFADTYTAFAPLYRLYNEYANYTLTGTALTIPPHVDMACDELSGQFVLLEDSLQTDSQVVEQIACISKLRIGLYSFCDQYRRLIAEIASLRPVDPFLLVAAADQGLFVEINELKTLFDQLFSITMQGLEGDSLWSFNAAFVTRTLLNQSLLERIDERLEQVLLGGEEGPAPPKWLPAEIERAIDSLVSLCGKELSSGDRQRAISLALQIHTFLLERAGG
ncbi:MAG: hypothetical protein U9Q23_02235, partial [Candidatus Bipolaricaulota bacterium]|nr:hypothetical protein [Candidatus Bipolaricaulota bacterium]